MNNKEKELHTILEIVVSCCAMEVDNKGTMSITKADVLSRNRTENVSMTRCIFVALVLHEGYSMSTIGQFLKRTVPSIRHLEKMSDNYFKTSRAYRIAMAEAVVALEDNKNNCDTNTNNN